MWFVQWSLLSFFPWHRGEDGWTVDGLGTKKNQEQEMQPSITGPVLGPACAAGMGGAVQGPMAHGPAGGKNKQLGADRDTRMLRSGRLQEAEKVGYQLAGG